MMDDHNFERLKILYYGGGWPTNIGNAFIDLGAMAILRAVCPNSQIAFASEMPRWFFEHRFKEPRRFLTPNNTDPVNMDYALDIASATQCDLIVFAGMAMCEEFINVNGPSVLALVNRGVQVLLLGTGALTYTGREKNLYGEFLRKVNPIGFISRDDRSYELFADFVKQSKNGIDCGFFVPEAYTPFKLALPPYVALAFDSTSEPILDLNGRGLIRAHHDCWGPSPKKYASTFNTVISDIPYDYLTLYANADEIHTDRVHACVAALAYGRRTQLYHSTPRGSLFDAVGAIGIREKLIQLDMEILEEKKRQQMLFVKDLLACLKSK